MTCWFSQATEGYFESDCAKSGVIGNPLRKAIMGRIAALLCLTAWAFVTIV
jgi:hypothetical protein